MSGNEVGRSAEADDSPWRPGADVVFEHPPRRDFGAHDGRAGGSRDDASGAGPTMRSGPWSRRLAVGAVVIAVGVGAWLAIVRDAGPQLGGRVSADATGSGAADGAVLRTDLGGDITIGPDEVPLTTSSTDCLPPRLPVAVEPLWETVVPDARRVLSPVSIGDGAIVGLAELDVPAASTGSSAVLIALDLADGSERWSAELEPATGAHEIVGIVDGAVVVRSIAGPDMAYRRLLAFDEGTGEQLWGEGFSGDWSASVVADEDLVFVDTGTPGTQVGEVVALAPRTAEVRATVPGRFLGVDSRRRLLTRAGDKVLALDLADEGDRDGRAGSDAEILGVVEPGTSPFTVAGGSVVVGQRNGSALSVFAAEPSSAEPPVGRRVPLVGFPSLERPGFVIGLDPLGESGLLVTGGGAVHGAELTGDSAEVRWRARGVALSSAPTDRGRAVLVATRGGASQRILDGSTGRTIADIELQPGALGTLGLYANGVVVQKFLDGAQVRSAIDLDGRELWRLPGSGPVAAGGGTVVDVDDGMAGSDASGVRIVALGGPDDCASP